MIPLFFYKKFTINSPLSQEEAVRKLSEVVDPIRTSSVWFETRNQFFEGWVSKDQFQITRIIWYRNSFLPIIYGRFSPTETGVKIRIVMTLHPIILLFTANFVLALGAFVLPGLYRLITTTATLGDFLTKPMAIILLVYVAFTFAFGIEAVIASRELERLFGAEQASENGA